MEPTRLPLLRVAGGAVKPGGKGRRAPVTHWSCRRRPGERTADRGVSWVPPLLSTGRCRQRPSTSGVSGRLQRGQRAVCMAALCAEGRTRDSPHPLLPSSSGLLRPSLAWFPSEGFCLETLFFFFLFFFCCLFLFLFCFGGKSSFQTAVTLHYLKGGSDHTVS